MLYPRIGTGSTVSARYRNAQKSTPVHRAGPTPPGPDARRRASLKTHPYFRWFPADAETDSAYSQLSLEALGLYHRMLNVSWMNHGLPQTPNGIAAALRVPRKTFLRLWGQLQPLWQLHEEKFYNPRQEEERCYARNVSERAQKGGKGKAFSRDLADNKQDFSRDLEVPRASVSDSVSVSESSSEVKTELLGKIEPGPIRRLYASDLNGHTSQKFPDWWDLWSKVRGTYNKTQACQAYISVVSTELETQCFECTSSYLASLESPNRGYNPENFLFTQAKDGFEARWPERKLSRSEALNRLLDEEG